MPAPLNIAVEEDQGSGVMNITGMQDNLHQYQGIINKQVGQIHMLTVTKINLIINLVIIAGIDIIHIPFLITHVIQLVILLIILVICHITQMTCTPLIL